MEEKPRLSRLMAIVTQLQSGRIITARDIAERHQVSIRTIYRDIKTLERSGIPIVTEEGKGFSLVEGFRIPPVMFSEAEANALITAEQIILRNKDVSLAENYTNAIQKIKAVLDYHQKDKAELLSDRIQVRANKREQKTSSFLMQLQSAITSREVLNMEYTALDGTASKRKIEPFALYTSQENWVLIAFCRLRGAFRSFRLDHISRLLGTGEAFQPHEMSLEEYLEACRKSWKSTPDILLSQASNTFGSNQQKKKMNKVEIDNFHLIGITVRTSNQDGKAAQDIPMLWQKFIGGAWMEKIPNKVNNNIYCLYTEYEGDHNLPYTTFLGCRVSSLDELPEGMVGKSFEGGTYEQFQVKGNLDEGLIINKWMEIWGMDLDRKYTADFEVYGEKSMNRQDAQVDIFIAVN